MLRGDFLRVRFGMFSWFVMIFCGAVRSATWESGEAPWSCFGVFSRAVHRATGGFALAVWRCDF